MVYRGRGGERAGARRHASEVEEDGWALCVEFVGRREIRRQQRSWKGYSAVQAGLLVCSVLRGKSGTPREVKGARFGHGVS